MNFIKKGNKKGRINFDYTNKEDVLKKLNLMDNSGKIKNAGQVLFGKDINIQLRAAIFATEEKTTFLDMKDFRGNIFKLIDDVTIFIKLTTARTIIIILPDRYFFIFSFSPI